MKRKSDKERAEAWAYRNGCIITHDFAIKSYLAGLRADRRRMKKEINIFYKKYNEMKQKYLEMKTKVKIK